MPASIPPKPAPPNAISSPMRSLLGGAPAALAFVLIAAFVVYLPVCGYEFSAMDDGLNVYLNPYLCRPDAQNIGFFWSHTYYSLYMPMTYTFWAILAHIAPFTVPHSTPLSAGKTLLNPCTFHAANLLLQLANTTLVFALLRRMGFLPWACAAGAMLFALHPLQVESVAWITGANNLLGGFFGLLALYLYYLSIPNAASDETGGRAKRAVLLVFATLSYAVALLSKPTSATIPLLCATVESLIFRRPLRRWIALTILWVFLGALCAFMSHFASHQSTDAVWSPLWGRFFIVGDTLAYDMVKTVAPIPLPYDYARSPRVVLGHWWGYVTWILPAVVIGLVWWKGRAPKLTEAEKDSATPRSDVPWLRVSLLFFIIGMLPTSGLLPFYSQAYTTVSNRYLYLALIGPAIALAYLLSRYYRLLSVAAIGSIVVLAVMTAWTTFLLPTWTNAYSLAAAITADAPDSAFSHALIGDIRYYRQDYVGALRDFQLVETLTHTTMPMNDHRISDVYVAMHKYDQAIPPLLRSIDSDSVTENQWTLLWFLVSQTPRTETVETFLRRRLQINPADGRAEFSLGVILMQRQRAGEAMPYLIDGARKVPDFAEMQYDLGQIYEQANQLPQAEAQYEQAMRVDPNNFEYQRALSSVRRKLGR